MKNIIMLMIPVLSFGCVKSYDIKTTATSDLQTQVWFQPQADGESLLLKVSNTTDTTMYIDWNAASFTYQETNESGTLASKSVPVSVFSKQEGLNKPTKVSAFSMLNSNAKSSVYTIVPKMNFSTSTYASDAKAYIYPPNSLQAPKQFKVTFALCSGELVDGVMPVECSKEGPGWKKISVDGTVGLKPAQ